MYSRYTFCSMTDIVPLVKQQDKVQHEKHEQAPSSIYLFPIELPKQLWQIMKKKLTEVCTSQKCFRSDCFVNCKSLLNSEALFKAFSRSSASRLESFLI